MAESPTQGERFARVGGHPAVDLVNTVDWRLDPERRSDRLASFSDVLAWCAETGQLSQAEIGWLSKEAHKDPQTTAEECISVLELREHTYKALIDPDETTAEAIATEYREAMDHASLVFSTPDNGWTWADSNLTVRSPRHRLARIIVGLLTDPAAHPVRQCQDEACGWVFLDNSPRRNRRWCVSADCGNRNRVRRHYQRRAVGADAQPAQSRVQRARASRLKKA